MVKLFVLSVLLLPLSCLAQFKISGRILNHDDSRPVENVSVFLDNSTIGSKTADDGTFTLGKVHPGKYNLVISIIGFKASKKEVIITSENVSVGDISISPKTMALREVVIQPDPYRQLYLGMFKEQFLGEHYKEECKILNPEIIDVAYNDTSATLTASSQDFIIIENSWLGYRIKYLLNDFTWVNIGLDEQTIRYSGSVFFEPMEGSESKQRRWQNRRQETYGNSSMHFFRALLQSRLDEEGFRVLRYLDYVNTERLPDSLIKIKLKKWDHTKSYGRHDSLNYWIRQSNVPKRIREMLPYPMNKGDLIRPTDQKGLYAFGCDKDTLYITYKKDRIFEPITRISPRLQTPANTEDTLIGFNNFFAIIDLNGVVLNTYAMSYYGVWMRDRVEELLPVDYQPLENVSGQAGEPTPAPKVRYSK